MSETTDFWTGEFGNQYTARNRVDWRARIPFWDRLVQKYGFRSVYEVGANSGWNLSAIKHSISGYNVGCHGCEINSHALIQAERVGFELDSFPINHKDSYLVDEYELTFTAGVLIHIGPEELKETMSAIVRASCDYVLAIEYEADTETEVEYRGHSGKLWKRPYGAMYEGMGLTMVETGKLGGQDGFDPNGVTYWLLRK